MRGILVSFQTELTTGLCEYDGHKYKGVVCENILNELLSSRYWSGFSGLEDKPDTFAIVWVSSSVVHNQALQMYLLAIIKKSSKFRHSQCNHLRVFSFKTFYPYFCIKILL